MKMNDIRSLQDEVLKVRLNDLGLELAIERRKVASTGVASKVVKIRDIKRTIARIQTVMNERGARR
jgi:ribosomal protein L29